ncbi:LysR family transcriptional regulator [Robbsia andropogonis]|uniref:LysR family transcriptional regulator n=1 Tax=Robbsia andropogonis TaxID=28092 RepID=UPI002A698DD2|nr:LysR family transcriptional regulator [Robbsia andropogonis]
MNPTDFQRVDLNLLRVFHMILDERSLTRAGQRLGLTQPAVSYALGRLRALFEDPLFVRTTDGMMPTPAAERLALPLGRAMAAIGETLRDAEPFDPLTSTREFRLTLSDVGEQVFLPPVCEALQQAAPHVRLAADPVPLAEIESRLRLGQLDFAIGNLTALRRVTRHAALFNEEWACMTRKRAGLPARTLSRNQFLELQHVAVSSTDSSHLAIDEALRERDLHRRIAMRVQHFTVIPQILLRTDWMVTIPRGVANVFNATGQFAIFSLPVVLPKFESTVHWHEVYEHDIGHQWFRTLLIDTLTHARLFASSARK